MRKLILLAVCLWPTFAMALTSQEVLVVANSASDDSVALAKFYMKARNIPQDNLLLIKTSGAYEISREDYEKTLRLPLEDFLRKDTKADKIRCIVFMWGIPVRVAAGNAAASNPAEEAIHVAVGRAHYRMAMDYLLMAHVGRDFPASMPAELLPPSRQFNVSGLTVKEPLDLLPVLLKNIAALSADKQIEIRRMARPEERALATRQMMSLYTDIFGLKGLQEYIADWHPQNAPDPKAIDKLIEEAQRRLDEVRKEAPTPENAGLKAALSERIGGLALVTSLSPQSGEAPKLVQVAVDSDLALILWSSEDRQRCREGIHIRTPNQSIPNTLNWQMSNVGDVKFPKVFMTARLDGPTAADAQRVLESALAVEKKGLTGTVYIDAGHKVEGLRAYGDFDDGLKRLAKFLTAKSTLKVVLDENEAVFAEGTAPDAAIYAGWYSVKNYVPAFKWVPGAVGIHYASYEAMELRNAKSKAWCTRMILEGVSATSGAVDEPYLDAFVKPEEFFPLLLTGKYTIGECYWRTVPLLNWRMMLIGDPLYNPFAAKPALQLEDLPKVLLP